MDAVDGKQAMRRTAFSRAGFKGHCVLREVPCCLQAAAVVESYFIHLVSGNRTFHHCMDSRRFGFFPVRM